MSIRTLAAIDIGSNAVRLLINNGIEQEGQTPVFRKNRLIRVPVRLGEEAFTHGTISDKTLQRLVKTMRAFDLLMQVYEVEKYRAYATSALREAKNSPQVVATVLEASGIEIEIIDGKREAAIIASADLKHFIKANTTYLYIDIGGGSAECTVFKQSHPVASKSFKIGTLRLLNHLVLDAVWDDLQRWITTHCATPHPVEIIGSGGNINKLHKMSGKKLGQPFSQAWLKTQYRLLERMTYHERMVKLGLNPDRADVIVPAAKLLLQVAQWSNAQNIHVPKIGLTDGMMKML